jgi:hypothetical protein
MSSYLPCVFFQSILGTVVSVCILSYTFITFRLYILLYVVVVVVVVVVKPSRWLEKWHRGTKASKCDTGKTEQETEQVELMFH